ncbi:histidine kinase [Flavitalea sp. BT771]|uniref:sensor histidine kinase n=1 Tax=Flavitalea sp. BT771 TaxID=3063329 RepID=UPI0026E1A637|nr:histidine kinase [Flavitalea sp. BT771]MDO6429559.1 histidine kinase [Flavitalea sp. BT771]MDV6218313.1 histidine kinase [Flavitalea sp. BT771]
MGKRIDFLWWAALYLFWVLVLQNRAFTLSKTWTIQFCYLLFIAANYYFHVGYAIPTFLYRKKYVGFGMLLVSGIVVTAILRVPLVIYMNNHFFSARGAQPPVTDIFYSSLLNISIWVIGILSFKLALDQLRLRKHMGEMEKEKIKAELDFLNAQFNPHFLFNSINSIYAHIDKRNPTARNMLLSFSEMLRYQLYDCNTHYISVDKEMGYIKNYVAIQQARKESSLQVCLSIGENVTGFLIAPLLFIAFIENAFKYVSDSDEKENKVHIRFEKREQGLLFTCMNTREGGKGGGIGHKGIGIANARRRMALLYPDKHALDIVDNEHIYEVTLNLQLS